MSRHSGATLRHHQVLPRGVFWCSGFFSLELLALSHELITKSDVTVAGFFLLSLCVCVSFRRVDFYQKNFW